MNANFERLISSHGAYSLPYLIHIHDAENVISMRYVNNSTNVRYDGNLYKAGTFSYEPNTSSYGFDGGGKLEIAIDEDADLIELLETNTEVYLEVVGAIEQSGDVAEIKSYQHHYGTASVTRTKIDFTFEADDRLSMTFPALVFNRTNNPGNS